MNRLYTWKFLQLRAVLLEGGLILVQYSFMGWGGNSDFGCFFKDIIHMLNFNVVYLFKFLAVQLKINERPFL